jgi:hypothetical protein
MTPGSGAGCSTRYCLVTDTVDSSLHFRKVPGTPQLQRELKRLVKLPPWSLYEGGRVGATNECFENYCGDRRYRARLRRIKI